MNRLAGNILVSGLIALFILVQPGPARADSASAVVQEFQATLIEVMKGAEKSSVRQRFDQLSPAVEKAFHIPLMTQIAVGQSWAQAPREQKSAVAAAFRRMSVATLATLFDGYNNERFDLDKEKPGPSKTTIVMTTLVKSDDSTVDIAYVARRIQDRWRLIDVIVDSGISELKVRRSEYRLILKKSGLSGLIELLNGKADELMSQ